MKTYTFDCSAFVTLRITAETKADARKALRDAVFDEAFEGIRLGAHPDGTPIIASVSLDDGEPDLVEIDGQPI